MRSKLNKESFQRMTTEFNRSSVGDIKLDIKGENNKKYVQKRR